MEVHQGPVLVEDDELRAEAGDGGGFPSLCRLRCVLTVVGTGLRRVRVAAKSGARLEQRFVLPRQEADEAREELHVRPHPDVPVDLSKEICKTHVRVRSENMT